MSQGLLVQQRRSYSVQSKGKRRRGRQKKRWQDNVKEEWTLPAHLGQLKAGQGGKGLLRNHLSCPDDLPRLWDRIEYQDPNDVVFAKFEDQ